ncbi:hypothetical protein RCL1_000696 [Eukaryota sp. TZLM3-RCL]
MTSTLLSDYENLQKQLKDLETDFDLGVKQIISDFEQKDSELVKSYHKKLKQQTLVISKVLRSDPFRLKESTNALKTTLEKKLETLRTTHAQDQAAVLRELERLFESERSRLLSSMETIEGIVGKDRLPIAPIPTFSVANQFSSPVPVGNIFQSEKPTTSPPQEINHFESETVSRIDPDNVNLPLFLTGSFSPAKSPKQFDLSKREVVFDPLPLSSLESFGSPLASEPTINFIPERAQKSPKFQSNSPIKLQSAVKSQSPVKIYGKIYSPVKKSTPKKPAFRVQSSTSLSTVPTRRLELNSTFCALKQKRSEAQNDDVIDLGAPSSPVFSRNSPEITEKDSELVFNKLVDLDKDLGDQIDSVVTQLKSISTAQPIKFSQSITDSLMLVSLNFDRLPVSSLIESSLKYANGPCLFDQYYEYDTSGYGELLQFLGKIRDNTAPKVLDGFAANEVRHVALRRSDYAQVYGTVESQVFVPQYDFELNDLLNPRKVLKFPKRPHQIILEQIISDNTIGLSKNSLSHTKEFLNFSYKKELNEVKRVENLRLQAIEEKIAFSEKIESNFLSVHDELSVLREQSEKKSLKNSQDFIDTSSLSIDEVKKLLMEKRRQNASRLKTKSLGL